MCDFWQCERSQAVPPHSFWLQNTCNFTPRKGILWHWMMREVRDTKWEMGSECLSPMQFMLPRCSWIFRDGLSRFSRQNISCHIHQPGPAKQIHHIISFISDPHPIQRNPSLMLARGRFSLIAISTNKIQQRWTPTNFFSPVISWMLKILSAENGRQFFKIYIF